MRPIKIWSSYGTIVNKYCDKKTLNCGTRPQVTATSVEWFHASLHNAEEGTRRFIYQTPKNLSPFHSIFKKIFEHLPSKEIRYPFILCYLVSLCCLFMDYGFRYTNNTRYLILSSCSSRPKFHLKRISSNRSLFLLILTLRRRV